MRIVCKSRCYTRLPYPLGFIGIFIHGYKSTLSLGTSLCDESDESGRFEDHLKCLCVQIQILMPSFPDPLG